MICCDFCSNAFCKKCILRNLGRKELSGILESKWYCYVCNPEPLFDLVVACDNVLENMDHLWQQQPRKNRIEPERSGLQNSLPQLPQNIPSDEWDHSGMDGNVVFNYNTLQASKELTKKAKHLVDSTNTLNRIFINFIHTVTKNSQTASVRLLYLKSFLSVVKVLQKTLAVFEENLKEEFTDLDVVSCWEQYLNDDSTSEPADVELSISDETCLNDLTKLAAEYAKDESDPKCFRDEGVQQTSSVDDVISNSCDAKERKEKDDLNSSEVSVRKELVVKLTPVAMEQKSSSNNPQMEKSIDEKSKGKDECKEPEVQGVQILKEAASASLHMNEKLAERLSPRVKTTPLRRPSDVKAQTSLSPAESDSDSDPDEIDPVVSARINEEQGLSTARDDSDSDEVPQALLERAAMTHSSEEGQSDEDDENTSTKVAKKCLFWLNKNMPISPKKEHHKRKKLDCSLNYDSSKQRVKARRRSGTDLSGDDRDSQKKKQCLRSSCNPMKREEKGVSGERAMDTAKSKSHQEVIELSCSSSEDDRDDSASDGSDQKIKPITDDIALHGMVPFHQSSGESFVLIMLCWDQTFVIVDVTPNWLR